MNMSGLVKTNFYTDSSAFDSVIAQTKRAISSTRKNKLKLVAECRVLLQQSYMKLSTQWGLYKADVLEKENISLDDFNSSG